MTLQLHDSGELSGRRWFKRAASTALKFNPYSAAAQYAWQNRKKIGGIAKEAATTYNPYYQAARFAWKRRPRFLREGEELSGYEGILSEIQETPTYYQFLQEEGLSGNEDQVELSGRFGTWIKTKAVPGIQKLQKNLAPVIGLLPGGGIVNSAFDIINRPKDGSVPGAPVEPVMVPQAPVQSFPQFAPQPQFSPAPSYGFAPAPMPSGGMNLPFGLDWKTLALVGLGGVVLYKTLKK
jgi:hypothetical protein